MSSNNEVESLPAGFASLGEAVEAVAAVDALLASLSASRAVLVDSVRVWADEQSDLPSSALVEALSVALRLPGDSVLALAEESRALVHEHPRTLAALRGGHISYGHAQTILGYTDGLHRSTRAVLETRLLERSRTCTVGELSLVAHAERSAVRSAVHAAVPSAVQSAHWWRQRSSQTGIEPVSAGNGEVVAGVS